MICSPFARFLTMKTLGESVQPSVAPHCWQRDVLTAWPGFPDPPQTDLTFHSAFLPTTHLRLQAELDTSCLFLSSMPCLWLSCALGWGRPSCPPSFRCANSTAFGTQLQHHLFLESSRTFYPLGQGVPSAVYRTSHFIPTMSSEDGPTLTHVHGPMSSLDFINSFFKNNYTDDPFINLCDSL